MLAYLIITYMVVGMLNGVRETYGTLRQQYDYGRPVTVGDLVSGALFVLIAGSLFGTIVLMMEIHDRLAYWNTPVFQKKEP